MSSYIYSLMIQLRDPNVNQTEEMCMEAVKQYGCALEYVKNQTEKICMRAVKQNCFALRYVRNQTHAICMRALEQDICAIYYVNNKTDAICIESLRYYYSSRLVFNFSAFCKKFEYQSPQLINELLKLSSLYTHTIMTSYACNQMKTYKTGCKIIVSNIVPHMLDILYRPNNVNALLIDNSRWHKVNSAKSLFLTL
jgi:Domain of unknown function (DUF4116)